MGEGGLSLGLAGMGSESPLPSLSSLASSLKDLLKDQKAAAFPGNTGLLLC